MQYRVDRLDARISHTVLLQGVPWMNMSGGALGVPTCVHCIRYSWEEDLWVNDRSRLYRRDIAVATKVQKHYLWSTMDKIFVTSRILSSIVQVSEQCAGRESTYTDRLK